MLDKERINHIINAMQDTRAENLMVFDMENRHSLTDHIILSSGRSQAHVRGIADKIEESLRAKGERFLSIEGYQEGSWVLLDYGMVLVHIFHPETRAYYDLEDLLKDFPCEVIPSDEEPAESAAAR